ncbi:RidA family protein [Rhodococcus sp. JS3073]|uniref:RidA family protein n=1 Tax=Rhodococcus sp. JS3073 TaxID=3002901 RepID=UPI002286B6C3|nr:Rid family detoxifying hydrolase [Rhodococcus sp. JS3073]WAM14545.1 Rid family detoxifying hydrolase [Rhodococcus sp. JS3073]
MNRQHVSTEHAPRPAGHYSQAIIAGGVLYTAGQTPHHPNTWELVGTTIEEQTEQAMRNLAAVLESCGSDFSHVVKATVHLQNPARDFTGFNETYQKFVSHPYPARTTVGSHLGDFLVEIDVVALCPEKTQSR